VPCLIDWSKLKPYQGSEWKSFEEFCYQIARRLYEEKGLFTSIDDSGGGDGVEFYLTLPNGDEWGWQAKHYPSDARLSDGNRKTNIKKSLNRALEKHSRLKKWFLCTPTNFTPSENAWLKDTTKKTKQSYPDIVIEHWGDREYNSYLSQALFLGIRNYFFGELELSSEWFKAQVSKQIKNVGNKFIPALHIETQSDYYIHCLLNDSDFRGTFNSNLGDFKNYIQQFVTAIETLKVVNARGIPEWDQIKPKLLFYINELVIDFKEIQGDLEKLAAFNAQNSFEMIESFDLSQIEEKLSRDIDSYETIWSNFEVHQFSQGSKRIPHNMEQATNVPLNLSREIASILWKVRSSIDKAKQRQMTILGDASIGKTHTACWTCYKRINQGLPAILLLGKHFTTGSSLEKQILQRLDIPGNYSWNDFLQALAIASKVYKTKIPIVIDALDEALQMNIWINELSGIACSIDNIPSLGLIVTCRSSYKAQIWPLTGPPNMVQAYGFDNASVKDAIDKYFDYYKIQADLTITPFEQFTNPMFLRIFCELSNRERSVTKEVFLGEQTLLGIFGSYIKQCNEVISAKLSRHSSALLVEEALRKIGLEIWKRKVRYLPLSDVVQLIDNKQLSDLDWPHSLTYALLDEGLLLNRDILDQNESVFFAYNLLGGFLIARGLLDKKNEAQIRSLVNSEEFERSLLSDNREELHPLSEDILKFVSLIIPTLIQKQLFEISDNRQAFNSSIEALFESCPEIINSTALDLIKDLFAFDQNRKPLLKLSIKTMRHPRHPLNIDFWEKLLTNLSMTERDLCWSEVIRRNSGAFLEQISEFELKCKAGNLTPADESVLTLYAHYFLWMLTSTVRDLRDVTTKALYWYGRRFPEAFFLLIESSLSINDPYISERMLAAGYGITMALQNADGKSAFVDSILSRTCHVLYDLMFKENAPNSTTHILSRDYALGIIKIALIHNPQTLTSDETRRVTEPFTDGGIRQWGQGKEKDEENYREGSMPVHMDFGNYTLGHLISDRKNYDDDNPEYKLLLANFFWRLYNLGYSHTDFSQIDRKIHLENWSNRLDGKGKTDRYGKKYSWIVFFELAGYRKDNGLLPKWRTETGRISEVDIDPSFPECNKIKIVTTDYLGDRLSSTESWIENEIEIDFAEYLICEKLASEERGHWVLLDGFVDQEDTQARRGRFIFSRGLFVKKDETAQVMANLLKCDPHNGRIPDVPEELQLFAGEIPWSKYFQDNGLSDLTFLKEPVKKIIPVKKVARLPDGSLIGQTELLAVLLKEYYDGSKEMEDMLQEQKIEVADKTVFEEVDVREDLTYQVFIPVRSYRWEGHYTITNTFGTAYVPAKEIANFFDLHLKPQTFNLQQKDGKVASLSFRYSVGNFADRQNQTYLRKDLLDKYLKENAYDLVWIIWGEREYRAPNMEIGEMQEYAKHHTAYKTFQSVRKYCP
jgi:hypothetical protein